MTESRFKIFHQIKPLESIKTGRLIFNESFIDTVSNHLNSLILFCTGFAISTNILLNNTFKYESVNYILELFLTFLPATISLIVAYSFYSKVKLYPIRGETRALNEIAVREIINDNNWIIAKECKSHIIARAKDFAFTNINGYQINILFDDTMVYYNSFTMNKNGDRAIFKFAFTKPTATFFEKEFVKKISMATNI